MTIRAGIAALLLALTACGDDSSDDLAERVDELEQENEALRAQLEAAEASSDVSTTTIGQAASPESSTAPAASSSVTTAPTATTTTAATTTTTPPGPGSQGLPIPAGEPVPAGDWVYTVVNFEPNVDPFVTQMDPDNPPAGEGKVYSRLRLRAEYRGQGAGEPRRLIVNLLTSSGTTIGAADLCCEPTRDALSDQPATFNGGSVEGWWYYPVPATELFAGPIVAFDPNADQPNVPGGTVFFYVN